MGAPGKRDWLRSAPSSPLAPALPRLTSDHLTPAPRSSRPARRLCPCSPRSAGCSGGARVGAHCVLRASPRPCRGTAIAVESVALKPQVLGLRAVLLASSRGRWRGSLGCHSPLAISLVGQGAKLHRANLAMPVKYCSHSFQSGLAFRGPVVLPRQGAVLGSALSAPQALNGIYAVSACLSHQSHVVTLLIQISAVEPQLCQPRRNTDVEGCGDPKTYSITNQISLEPVCPIIS